MTGSETLQGLRDAVIQVLSNTQPDPSPAVGIANLRQVANTLVLAAQNQVMSVEATQLIMQILNIPDAPEEVFVES